jgi:phospholipid/cholesterol/gamma-HCH transport system substrate-binding protein
VSAPTNRWKLGLFVAGTVLIGLGAAGYLAARTLQRETIHYKSYFDEGVTGLETGSSVSFRGVKVGNVSAIDVAPDRRHVEITYQLGVLALQRLGIASGAGKHVKLTIPPELRVQIGSSGLTGAKYLQIDFLDATKHPAPQLPFPVAENTIPSMPSTMDAVYRAVDQLPDLTRELGRALEQVTQLLTEVRAGNLPGKAAATFASVDRILASLDRKLDQLKVAELSGEARAALASVSVAMGKANRMLDQMDGDRGLLASMQRASDALGDVAGGAKGLGPGLEDTLADLRGAGVAVRALVDALERDPDMFVKGRTKAER